MFFRRKQKKSPPEQRISYRRRLDEDEPVRVVIARSEGESLEARMLDLSMHGAGLCVSEPKGLGPQMDDVLELTIESEQDGWKIHTPGVVRQVKPGQDGALNYGVEFINLGMLYSQMDDTLARYFNRRVQERVSEKEEQRMPADLYSAGHRLLAVVYDLTPHGVALLVRHAEATALRINTPARVSLKLPGMRNSVSGDAVIRQHRPIHDQDVVGLQFDLRAEDGFAAQQERIEAYCAKCLAERAEWERSRSEDGDEDDEGDEGEEGEEGEAAIEEEAA